MSNLTDHLNVGAQAANYWLSPMTRQEAQKVFDDYAKVLTDLKETLLKLDFAVGYLLEKSNVQPSDIKEFMDRKMEEFLKATNQKIAEEKAGELGRDA